MGRPKAGKEKKRNATLSLRIDKETQEMLNQLVERRVNIGNKVVSRADVITELIQEAYENDIIFFSEPYDDDPVDVF